MVADAIALHTHARWYRPTLVIGTASTFVHRFYMRETVQQFPPEVRRSFR